MFDAQMEMSFGRNENFATRSERRHNRARWWFQRMRQVVDLAIDWQPAPRPRPIQIWFPTTESRLTKSSAQRAKRGSARRRSEQGVCE